MEKIEGLFQELNVLIESEQYESASHVCDRIKAHGCQDVDIQRMKVFCLMQRKMWNQALFQIKDLESHSVLLPYEKSYCLYRMNNFGKALECIESLGDPSKELTKVENRAIYHLKAQILYRLGRFIECDHIYSELKQSLSGDSQMELEMLEVNHLAVLSSLNGHTNTIDDLEIPEFITNSFEYWFNRCCLYVSNKDYDNALTALDMSESIYNTSTEMDNSDSTDNELNPSDLCSFMIMRAFILQKCGDIQTAKDIYEKCLKKFSLDGVQIESSMVHLGVSVFNNINSISKNLNSIGFTDGLKRLSIASKDNIEHKMNMEQNFIISLNKALMSFDKCEFSHYIKEATKYSNGDPRLELFKVSIYLLQDKTKKAFSHIDSLHKKFPQDLSVSISLIRILLKLKNVNLALKIVESISNRPEVFFDSKTNPNLFEQFLHLFALVMFGKYPNSASDMVKQKLRTMLHMLSRDMISRSNSNTKFDNHSNKIICVFGNFLLKWRLFKEAKDCFSIAMDTQNCENECDDVVTGYIIASTLDKSQIPNSLIRGLVNKLPSKMFSIDAEILDNSDFFHKSDPKTKQESSNSSTKAPESKKKRKRKPRYPKGFDPNEPGPLPDPDRWLPKEERASFKKLNKNRNSKKKKHSEKGGHQGAFTTESSSSAKDIPSTAKKVALSESDFRRTGRKKKR